MKVFRRLRGGLAVRAARRDAVECSLAGGLLLPRGALRHCARGALLAFTVALSSPVWAHGFHGAALLESSASAWEAKVRGNLGLPSTYESGGGDVRELLKRKVPGPPGGMVTMPRVERAKVKATVQELVSYLKYMERENILPEEFPNFPMNQIPEFRRRAVYILGDIGPAALPEVLAGMADAAIFSKPGATGPSKFEDPYFDPTLAISKDCRKDLDKALDLIVASAALSSDALATALDTLPALMEDEDPVIKTAARGAMRSLQSRATAGALLGLAANAKATSAPKAIKMLRDKLSDPTCKLTLENALQAMDAVKSNPSPELKKVAATIVERCYAGKDADALVKCLNTVDKELKPSIAQLLASRLRATHASLSAAQVSALLELLWSADERAVSSFEEALDAGANEAHVALMKKAATDPSDRVRAFAMGWLLTSFPQEVDPGALLQALQEPDSRVGMAVYRSLARRELSPGEAQAFRTHPDLLLKALHARAASVRAAAAKFAGKLAMREAVPDLIALLTDHDNDVFQAAATALPTITHQFLGPDLFADDQARQAAQRKWRAWWREQAGK